MAADAPSRGQGRRLSIAPTAFEKSLAMLCAVMLLVVLAALGRGVGEWGRISAVIWFHVATIGLALALTPLVLLRRRGDRWHRITGYVWVTAIMVTAIATYWIRETNPGKLSLIHLLSLLTLIQLPRVIMAARRHDAKAHRRGIQLMVAAGLLITGFFTLVPGRILGDWLLY